MNNYFYVTFNSSRNFFNENYLKIPRILYFLSNFLSKNLQFKANFHYKYPHAFNRCLIPTITTTTKIQTPPKKGLHIHHRNAFSSFLLLSCARLFGVKNWAKWEREKVHSRLLLFNPFSLHIISFKMKKLFFFCFFNALTTMNMFSSSASLSLNSLNFSVYYSLALSLFV